MKKPIVTLVAGALALASSTLVYAETVGVFFDSKIDQIKFAAGDVKTALEKKKFTVEMMPLDSLKASYGNPKVVLALSANAELAKIIAAQGASELPALGEQAFVIRTTQEPKKSYWALGGDANGTMYGGFQIAEEITFNGFSGNLNLEESPKILKRGIKLNLPLDRTSGTYDTLNKVSDSAEKSIPHVWDMSFWTEWFDEMARHRYNVVSVWNNHPFTSMIKMPDYPDVVIQNVKGYDGFSKTISIEEKIEFWRKVMAYAHSRGFEYYLVNWNIFTYGASGKYGITDDRDKAATCEKTIAYMRKCMTTLLETYPDLDGFGVTQGEHMSEDKDDNTRFMGKTYGLGMVDYLKSHPDRKMRFIHRWHMADFSDMKENFAELMKLPNVTFDMSFKYSKAHMYATEAPRWITDNNEEALRENKLKSWLTVRNDSFYFHHWGDPKFVRAYIEGIPGKDDWFRGMLLGSDGFIPTRVFYSKNSVTQGMLEINRRWYMSMLWGRLTYNPSTPDSVFKNHMKLRFPEVSSDDLFTAWSKASSGLPKATELVHGDFKLDFQWWPEACQSHKGFIKVSEFADAKPGNGSKLCSIADSAAKRGKGGKSSFELADEIEVDAKSALSIVEKMKADPNTELGVTLNSIRNMSYLTLYYAQKIRAATHLKADEKEKAKEALGTAYKWWIKYSSLMDSMFTGMTMQRSDEIENWHVHDESVLKEYTDLGGSGVPK